MELNKKHYKAVQLLFEGEFNNQEIAAQLKVTERTLYNWMKDEKFIKAQDVYANKQLVKFAPKAIRTMYKLLDADSEQVQLNAAKDIMDRTGFKPKNEVELSGAVDIQNTALEIESYINSSDTS